MFNNPYLMIDNISLNALMKRAELIKSIDFHIDKAVTKMDSQEIEKAFSFAPVLQKEGSRAMISINGPMAFAPNLIDRLLFGAVSTQEIMAAVGDVAQDKQIESVVFAGNTPGGEATKMHVLANMVHSLSMQKSTASVNTGMTASAGYFVLSQTSHMFVEEEMNETGSIGCVTLLHDFSEAAKMAGVKVTKVATGPLKGAGMQGTAITADMVAMVQEKVNKLQEGFSNAVERGRPNSDMSDGSEARSGQSFFQADAERLGLSDGIKSLDEAFEFLDQGARANNLRRSI